MSMDCIIGVASSILVTFTCTCMCMCVCCVHVSVLPWLPQISFLLVLIGEHIIILFILQCFHLTAPATNCSSTSAAEMQDLLRKKIAILSGECNKILISY